MKTTFNSRNLNTHKLAVLLSFILISLNIQAQIEKGTVSFGIHNFSPSGMNIDGVPLNLFGKGFTLGASWGTSKTIKNGIEQDDAQSIYTFGLNLNSHYFIADNFSVGITGSFFSGYSVYAKQSNEDGRYSARIWMGGPEVRYFFGTGRTKTWVKASASFGALNVWWDRKKHVPMQLSQLDAGAGVSFFLSRVISIDAGLGYNIFTMKPDANTKGINKNLSLDLGFGLFF
ncbi:MAG: hypothetical protein ABIQ02_00670 [Saprospiraceae bacterium]